MNPEEVRRLVLAAMPGADVAVQDMTGTGDHFEVSVIWSGFEGKALVEQHQAVLAALGSEMDRRIHAVKLKTKLPKKVG